MSFKKEILPTTLEGVRLIKHSVFEDLRGQLWTTFDPNIAELCEQNFVHDKFAKNKAGVIRGIHGDYKSWKLVTAVAGSFFQVVVDCRPNSHKFLHHETFTLSELDYCSLLIPPGFGNGFCSLTDNSLYHYKLAYEGAYADADEQFTYKWDDPKIGIKWPVAQYKLSKRDK